MLCKERDVNRNGWSKVAENLDFMQNIHKCRHEKLNDCNASPVAKDRRVSASLSATEIHFPKHVSFFGMAWATIAR